jgi:hypothetical protein
VDNLPQAACGPTGKIVPVPAGSKRKAHILQKGKHVSRQTVTTSRESAEMLAVEALAFLAEDGDRLGRFLALTGVAPTAIRAAARQPGFLAAVLDHLAGDEPLLMAFASQGGHAPADILRARAALGGPDWERDSA